jgi:hypothetical protein
LKLDFVDFAIASQPADASVRRIFLKSCNSAVTAQCVAGLAFWVLPLSAMMQPSLCGSRPAHLRHAAERCFYLCPGSRCAYRLIRHAAMLRAVRHIV